MRFYILPPEGRRAQQREPGRTGGEKVGPGEDPARPASRPPRAACGLGRLCASADSSLSSRVLLPLPSLLPLLSPLPVSQASLGLV